MAQTFDAIAAQVPDLARPNAYVFRAAVGAIHELVTDCLLKRGAQALPELLPAILEIELRLLSGRVPEPPRR
jgi:hypothetical protein